MIGMVCKKRHRRDSNLGLFTWILINRSAMIWGLIHTGACKDSMTSETWNMFSMSLMTCLNWAGTEPMLTALGANAANIELVPNQRRHFMACLPKQVGSDYSTVDHFGGFFTYRKRLLKLGDTSFINSVQSRIDCHCEPIKITAKSNTNKGYT